MTIRRTACLLLALSILAPAAGAQEKEALCALLPQEGQGAAYVPGVDVHGAAVVPADLPAAGAGGEAVGIPVTIDLARQLGATLPVGTEMKIPVAVVEVRRDGRVVYNGNDVTGRAYAACGKTPPAPQKETASPSPCGEEAPAPQPRTTERKGDIVWQKETEQ